MIASNFAGIKGGLVLSLISFSIVFLLIAILMFLLMVLHKACHKFFAEKENTMPKNAEKWLSAKENTATADEELVAVLTAAVAEFSGGDARVVSFAPSATVAPTKSCWKNTARTENFERM